LFFKADEHLTPEEQAQMQALLATQPEVNFIRRFLHQVWAIFEGPQTEAEAYAKFAELKESVAYHDSASGFTKAVNFLRCGKVEVTICFDERVPNPTSGSWWIVHSPPTPEPAGSPQSHQRKLVDRSLPTYPRTRRLPSIPPAEAGGSFTPHLQ
jgi:hypothetical protein